MISFCIVLVALFVDYTQAIGYVHWKLPTNWSYSGATGPSNWCKIGYKECCGTSQSPINLKPHQTRYLANTVQLTNYEVVPNGIHLKNIADTVKFSFETTRQPTIKFSESPTSYVLDNVHFHWGANSRVGSEHTVDDHHFPMEAHFVHRDSQYTTSDEASLHPNGIVVLSTFYKISPEDNLELRGLVHDLKHVKYAEQEYNDTRPFSVSKLLPELHDGSVYFTYDGSLTTPPCHQSVKWVILRHHVPISERQMHAFRQLQIRPKSYDLLNNHPLVNNYRPGQPLNHRALKYSDLPYSWR